MHEIQREPPLGNEELNALFRAAWSRHRERDFGKALAHSLAYFAVRDTGSVIGFVNVAWDGDAHAFVLDVTVHPEYQRRGIGTGLLREAAQAAAERGCEWLHVDFEAELEPFYRTAGYRPTAAGLLHLPHGR